MARTGNSTCAGCATIRRLMKCPGRVILRRHNGASSGSSRIISLGCVRAANNSLLFPAPGTDDVSLMTMEVVEEEEDRRNVCSFVSHSSPVAASGFRGRGCRRDRARDLPRSTRDRTRRARVSVDSREINRLRARLSEDRRIFYAEVAQKLVQS